MRIIDWNLHIITGVLILILWKNFIYWQEYNRFSLEVFSDNKSHFFSLAVTNKAVSAWLAMWSQRKLLFFVLNFAKKRHSWELPSYILIVLQLLTVTSSHKKVKGKEAKREKKRNSLNETYWSFNVDFSWFTWAPFLYEVIVTIMCRNDELSWLFTNRLSATR